MTVAYSISVNRYIDSKGEYDLLNKTLSKFGAGIFPLLTDRKGNHIIEDDINADFKYTVSYDYDNGNVIRTYVNVLGFTLNIPIDADIASRVNYRIQEIDDWNTIKDSYSDYVMFLGSYEDDKKSELDVQFEFEEINGGISNEYIENAVAKDISRLVTIISEVVKDDDSNG